MRRWLTSWLCSPTPPAPRSGPRHSPTRFSADSRSGWLVTKDGQAFTLRVTAVPAAGTVDYLREVAPGREGGAYLRVIPRPGGGSVIIMTLPVPPGADPAATAATLAAELAALVSLAEAD